MSGLIAEGSPSRVSAEERLRRISPPVLLAMLDGLPGLVAFWGRDQRNVVANRAYVEYFGWTPESMAGVHMRDVLGEDVYALNLPFILGALAGEEQRFDRRLVDQHGRVRDTQASYVPYRPDSSGEVEGFFVLVTDVTERVEAERRAQQAAEQYRALAASVPDGFVLLFDTDLRFTIAEGEALRAFGYAPGELEGMTIHEAFPPRLAGELEPRYRGALAGRRAEWEWVRGDRIFRLKSAPVVHPDGRVFAGMVIASDVTSQQRAEAISAALQEISKAVARQAPTATVCELIADNLKRIFRSDAAAVVQFMDPDHARIIAMSPSRPDGIPDDVYWPGAEGSVTWQVARTGRPALARYDEPGQRYVAALQAEGLVAGAAAPIHHEGELWGAVTLNARDAERLNEEVVDQLARFAELLQIALGNLRAWSGLRDQAMTDPLTGLGNRRGLDAELQRQSKLAVVTGEPLGVAMIDIDHFKQINDEFGHPAGDRVLSELAGLLRATARTTEVIARVGGEEFVWLMPATTTERASLAGERLRRAVEDHDFGLARPVTASIGIASAVGGSDPDGLVAAADRALYQAKRGGRNRVVSVEHGSPSGRAG